MLFHIQKQTWVILILVLLTTTNLYAQGNPYTQKAEALQREGNYQGALLEYENAINHDPANYKLWLKQGNIYATLKDWSNASRAIEKVVELNQDYLEGYLILRKIYQQTNKPEKAILALNKAFQHDTVQKRKVGYKMDIISLLNNKEQLKDAFQHIQDAKKLDNSNSKIWYYEAKYFNLTKDYQKAIQSAETALQAMTSNNPKESSQIYYEIGFAYHQLEDYENARMNLAKANYGEYKALVFKMTHVYHLRIAQAYFKAQDYENSAKFVEIALKMSPNFKKAKSLQKRLVIVNQDNQSKIDSLKQLANHQKHPILKAEQLAKLADLYYKSQDYSQALTTIKETLDLEEENLNHDFLKAMAYYQTNKYNESAQALEQILQIKNFSSQEDKAVYFFVLGLIAEQSQNKDLAIKHYKKASFGDFRYAVADRLERLEKNS